MRNISSVSWLLRSTSSSDAGIGDRDRSVIAEFIIRSDRIDP